MGSFDELPTELMHLILQTLPISDLLSFASTSKSNRTISIQCLTTLDLAIFPRRIHSLLSFFDALADDEDDDDQDETQEDASVSKYWARQSMNDKTLYQVGLITNNSSNPSPWRPKTLSPSPAVSSHIPRQRRQGQTATPSSRSTSASQPRPTPLSVRTAEIATQNMLATRILQTPSLSNLRTLTLRLYDLSHSELASTLATSFPELTALNLEFCHPYIHDTTLPAKFWRDTVPAGSPIWNVLAGVGDEHVDALRLRSLRSLKMNRSGITSFQLGKWLETNPDLRELKLGLCRGVDKEFVQWLGNYALSRKQKMQQKTDHGKLEVVRLTDCTLLELKDHDDDDDTETNDFAWVDQLAHAGVIDFSLRGCKSVDEETFLHLATTRWIGMGMKRIVSPKGVVVRPSSHPNSSGSKVTVNRSRVKGGSASPALTVSDGVTGTGGSSGLSFLGKIEVDPAMAL